MTDTQWADVSEYQVPVNDQYPWHFFSFRSNDGTYVDHDFAANLAWTKHAVDQGLLVGFMVYFVYEENWQQTLETFQKVVGTPHPRMAVMIDVESWGSKITGDQSVALNSLRNELIAWLGGNKKRVVAYGNQNDLETLWSNRGDIMIGIANYSFNPSFPNKLFHQYSDRYNTPPFGYCDINSADGYSPEQLATALGFDNVVVTPKPVPTPPPAPKPKPAPKPVPPKPAPQRIYVVRSGDTLSGIANKFHTTWQHLAAINHIANANKIYVGQRIVLDGTVPNPVHTYYRVRSGDTLSGIAARYGVKWGYLQMINNLKDPNKIYVGQVLRIR